jgi:hypothetical protein
VIHVQLSRHETTRAARPASQTPEHYLAALTALSELLAGLTAVAERKLAALRAADAGALHACAADENVLLRQMMENQQQRTELQARLAQEQRLEPAGLNCLSEIARLLPEPQASAVRARALGLRVAAERLRDRNRLAGEVARHLQGHIRAIFAGLAEALQESCGYGPDGQTEASAARSVVDAIA